MRLICYALISILLSGCFTFRWSAQHKNLEEPLDPSVVPSYLSIIRNKQRPNHFTFENKSSSIVFVSYKESVLEIDGTSHRVVSGETTGRNVDRDSSDTPIAPNTKAEVSFYIQSGDIVKLFSRAKTVKFRVAVRRDDHKREYVVIENIPGPPKALFQTVASSKDDKLLCYATLVLAGGYCWLVQPREEDYQAAKAKGDKVINGDAEVRYIDRYFQDLW